MKRILTAVLLATLLAACASQEEKVTEDKEQAIRDFIAVHQLPEQDKVRTSQSDSWHELEPHFVLYVTRRETYLVEFARFCHELNDLPVVADTRSESNTMRARFDTLRGCRIDKIYSLSEGEVAELVALGEAPGSRN